MNHTFKGARVTVMFKIKILLVVACEASEAFDFAVKALNSSCAHVHMHPRVCDDAAELSRLDC